MDAACHFPQSVSLSPCQRCGACCAYFRVPVARDEIDDMPGGIVPLGHTDQGANGKFFMRGSGRQGSRCMALEGRIGRSVTCRIYDRRPYECRCFAASWESGRDNDLCNRARSAHGLAPFSPF